MSNEMSNEQIERACQRLSVPLVCVTNKNLMPQHLCEGGIVINLSDSVDAKGRELPGTHWTAVYVEKGKKGKWHGAYFDTFGAPPPVAVQQYLRPTVPYSFSCFDIQSVESGWCGTYCVLFLFFMSRNRCGSFEQRFLHFLQMWSSDNPTANLTLLKSYFKELRDAGETPATPP